MRVLVTGASGFVGKNVLLHKPAHWEVTAVYHSSTEFEKFLKDNAITNVTPIRCDLTNEESTKAAFAGKKFDACLYLAAHVDPNESLKNPVDDLRKNTLALVAFLQSGVTISRFVFLSSGSVYEGATGSVTPETTIHPLLPYSIAKEMSERYVESATRYGVLGEYVIVRFFGCFGPYEPERKLYRKIVRRFAIEHNPEIEIYGDGSNMIYAMYAEDAAVGLRHVIEGKAKNLIVDFCGEEHYTIKELVERAGKEFGITPKILYSGTQPAESHVFSVSNARMLENFKFIPQIKLEPALKRYKEFLTRGK